MPSNPVSTQGKVGAAVSTFWPNADAQETVDRSCCCLLRRDGDHEEQAEFEQDPLCPVHPDGAIARLIIAAMWDRIRSLELRLPPHSDARASASNIQPMPGAYGADVCGIDHLSSTTTDEV